MVTRLLGFVGGLSTPLLVLVAFGLAFGESAILLDFVVPGEAGAAVVGAAGNQGDASLLVLILAVALGSLVGDSLGFALGSKVGTSVLDRWSFTRKRLSPKVDHAAEYVERHGGRAVFVGRWVGALRALVPLVAGHSGMSYRRFIAWDIPAAISWATAIVCAGWFVGSPAAEFIDRTGPIVPAVVVVVAIGWWLLRRHRKRASGEGSTPTPATSGAS
ncbi:MAG: DedA family protein [Acidimicrobiia bacterium]|nr:DedA family protein [Acidimicrobiia bacterium]